MPRQPNQEKAKARNQRRIAFVLFLALAFVAGMLFGQNWTNHNQCITISYTLHNGKMLNISNVGWKAIPIYNATEANFTSAKVYNDGTGCKP